MFDAKSILENIVRGAAPQAQAPQGGGGLGDILGQILQGGAHQGQGGGGGLGDILGQLQRQLGQAGGGAQQADTSGGGLGDILEQLQRQLGQAGGGGLADILGEVLGQATSGMKEGATRIGEATGAKDVLGQVTGGQSPEELLEKLRGLVRDNPIAATGAAAGAGGAILGTRAGRAVASGAVKIGALALIGGLAYKAFQNYQAGRPLVSGVTAPEAAPQGSGFEPAAVTNESAALYIRTMIAAAAADGRIDDAEQAKVLGALKQAGVDAEAEEFLANELNSPASVEDLAGAVTTPEEAVQLYTAARIAVEPDSAAEKQFLTALAGALGIDAKLAAHIDATTHSAAA